MHFRAEGGRISRRCHRVHAQWQLVTIWGKKGQRRNLFLRWPKLPIYWRIYVDGRDTPIPLGEVLRLRQC